MPLTIAYLLKLSICLSLVYLFYQILLRRLTFYHWNRWYLIGYSIFSFFIPFFNISPLVEAKKMGEVKLIQYIPVVTNYTGATNTASISSPIHSFDKWDIMLFLLLTGIFIFTVRLIIQLVSLRRLRQKSTLINDAGTPIYHVDKNIIPFSFGNAIYVNQQLHEPKELEEIILHEYVHVKQNHSIDILLMELVCIFNWLNPFAWLLRHAVRQNLEFIADDDVLKTGMDKKAYQYHLLQVVGLPQYRISNSFNLSSLKKRIAMMNKFKSAKIHLIRFLFVLPLLAALLLAFRERVEKGIMKIVSSPAEMKNKAKKNDSLELQFSSMGKSIPKPLTITKNHIDTIPFSKKIIENLNDVSNLDLKKVLCVIDSVEVPKGVDWATFINPAAIKSMSVYRDKSAIEKYGQKGKDGVISITTKNNDEFAISYQGYQIKEGYRSDSIPLNIDASQDDILKFPRLSVVGMPLENSPLYFIDGKEVESIKSLAPDQIESINVLKDSMAIKQYGEKGRNGVILIKTKLNGNKTVSNDTLPKAINANQKGKHNFTVKDIVVVAPDQPSPLYFIDGREVKSNEVIYPNQIKSMNLLEESMAIKQYGERGRNGAILMGTKEPNANSFSQRDKRNQQNDSSVISNVGHPSNRQPLMLFGNNNGDNDPVLFIADTISYNNTNLRLSGSMTIFDSITAIIKGNFFFAKMGDIPLVLFNGKKLNRIDNFKASNGQYRIIRLNKELAMAKYGDRRASNGAIEISSL